MRSTSSLMLDTLVVPGAAVGSKAAVDESIRRLSDWLEEHDYRGYDTFDGLNARFVRPLTFNSVLLRTVLLQEYGGSH